MILVMLGAILILPFVIKGEIRKQRFYSTFGISIDKFTFSDEYKENGNEEILKDEDVPIHPMDGGPSVH